MPQPVFIGVGRLRGTWNASTNALYQTNGTTSVPTSPSGTIATLSDGNWRNEMDTYVGYSADEGPKVGDYLKVIADGTTEIDGHSDWRTGDWVVYCSGSVWRKVSRADAIASVVVGDMTSSNALSNALLTGSHSRWEQQVLFVSGNAPTASFTGSNSFTYQYATNASTAYSALRLTGNLLVDGQIQAKQINTVFHSRSIMYESGSTRFGDSTYDLHEFSGALRVNSSLSGTSEWTGSLEFDGDISGAATHKITYPYVTASAGMSTSKIGMVGDNNQIEFAVGTVTTNAIFSASLIAGSAIHGQTTNHAILTLGHDGSSTADAIRVGTGADPCLLTGSTVSASIGVYTPQIGVSGDDDLLGLASGVVTVNGAVSASGFYAAQIGVSGDDDLLGLEAGELDISGTLYVYPGGKTQPELIVASGSTTISGSVTAGKQNNGHEHVYYGGFKSMMDSSDTFWVTGGGSNSFRVDATSWDWGATAGNSISTLVRDNNSSAWTIGSTGGSSMIKLDTTDGANTVVLGSKTKLDGINLTGSSGVEVQVPIVSASAGVYTSQIGVSGDDDLMGLASGVLTVNGAVSASGIYTTQIGLSGDDDLLTLAADTLTINGNLSASQIYGPAGALTIRAENSLRIHLDDDDDFSFGDFTIYDGDDNTLLSIQEAGGASTALVSASFTAQRRSNSDLTLINVYNQDTTADTDGKVSVGWSMNDSLAGTQLQAAKIRAEKEQTWDMSGGGAGIDASLVFQTTKNNSLADQMIIKSDGKVGIGIADPDSYVDEKDNLVVGATTGNTGMTLVSSPTAITTIQFRGNTTVNDKEGWIDYSQNTERMRFGTAGLNTRMTIDSAGGVGIGASTITGSAILELSSSTRGLVLSRLTETQRDAVSDPAKGLIIYNTSDNELNIYSGSWGAVAGTGGGGGGTVDGSGAATRLALWNDGNTLESDANLTWTGSDVLTMSGTLLLTSNTTTGHRITGSVRLKTDDATPGDNDTGFSVRGETGNGRGIMTVDDNNNALLVLSGTDGKTMFRAGASTETAPHADYNIDRARKFILSGSTFIGSSGQTQTNVDTHDVWGHLYCTSGSIRVMSGATGRQDDFYGINLPNHSDKLGSIRANAFPTYSSLRWKYNVEAINEPLTRINQLRGVFFDWKETGKSDMGFIAEEVGEVLPRIVRYEDDGTHAESLDYGKIIPLCVEAIKALSTKNESLEKQIQELKKKI